MSSILMVLAITGGITLAVAAFLLAILVLRNPHNPEWVNSEGFSQFTALWMTTGISAASAATVQAPPRASADFLDGVPIAERNDTPFRGHQLRDAAAAINRLPDVNLVTSVVIIATPPPARSTRTRAHFNNTNHGSGDMPENLGNDSMPE